MPHPASCPCKYHSFSLGAFTSAQFGDLQSLLNRKCRDDSNGDVEGRRLPASLATLLDSYGYTPLHYAAQHGHVVLVSEMLHPHRCARDRRRREAGTAPPWSDGPAAPSEDFCVEDGVPTSRGGCGATPLHRAAFSGSWEVVSLLASEWDADLLAVDRSCRDGQTPLHKAVRGGRPGVVQLLLQCMADKGCVRKGLGVKDLEGLTVLKLAERMDETGIADDVKRWDTVAGGAVDWKKCLEHVKKAIEKYGYEDRIEENETKTDDRIQLGKIGCEDLTKNCKYCVTISWTSAFLEVCKYAPPLNDLQPSSSESSGTKFSTTQSKPVNDNVFQPVRKLTDPPASRSGTLSAETLSLTPTQSATKSIGAPCSKCGTVCLVLHRPPVRFRACADELICQHCLKALRRKN